MNLQKFVVIDQKENGASEEVFNSMLLNLDHVVSVKPIRIQKRGELIQGYWVRLSNGKKYRAVEIPETLLALLTDDSHLTEITRIDLDGQDQFNVQTLQ